MKFFADEGVDGQIVARLRTDGYEVIYAAEESSDIEDTEKLDLANKEGCISITIDKDFGDLIYRDKKVHTGIILNRLAELTSETKAELVSKIIHAFEAKLIGAYTVIEPSRVRIKEMK